MTQYLSLALIYVGITFGLTVLLGINSFVIRDLELAKITSLFGLISIGSGMFFCAWGSELDQKKEMQQQV